MRLRGETCRVAVRRDKSRLYIQPGSLTIRLQCSSIQTIDNIKSLAHARRDGINPGIPDIDFFQLRKSGIK